MNNQTAEQVMDSQVMDSQVDDKQNDGPISDEELLILAKKGSARLRWKFKHLNDDLLGESFRAAVIARNRGLTRGGVVLSVRGRCLNMLGKEVFNTAPEIMLEKMGSRIKVEEQYIMEIGELVTDLVEEFLKALVADGKSWHRVNDGTLPDILRYTAEGYTCREIEGLVGVPYQDVANRLEFVGHTLAKKRRYKRYARRVIGKAVA